MKIFENRFLKNGILEFLPKALIISIRTYVSDQNSNKPVLRNEILEGIFWRRNLEWWLKFFDKTKNQKSMLVSFLTCSFWTILKKIFQLEGIHKSIPTACGLSLKNFRWIPNRTQIWFLVYRRCGVASAWKIFRILPRFDGTKILTWKKTNLRRKNIGD